MHKIVWTSEAEKDLEGIVLYHIEQNERNIAKLVFLKIREQIVTLTNFPKRTRPGRISGTREFIISRLPYIAILQVSDNTVTILNILHTSRKYPN